VNNTVVGFNRGIEVGTSSAATFENMLLDNVIDIGLPIRSYRMEPLLA
jgi:hypothetical protein